MSLFQVVKENIINMEYGFTEPKSLVVFIPAVSLVVQRIQASHLLNHLRSTYPQAQHFNQLMSSHELSKLDTMFKWHIFGSIVQAISLLALSAFNPACGFLALGSTFEFWSSVTRLGNLKISYPGPNQNLVLEK